MALSETQKQSEKPPGKAKILIAEDEESSFLFLSYLLKKINCRIIRSISGTETVQQCIDNPDIDIILMDIKMPEMNGYEATQKIRSFNEKVHIIAQTAFTLPGSKEKAIEAGCDDYIPKPINGEALINKINAVLFNERC